MGETDLRVSLPKRRIGPSFNPFKQKIGQLEGPDINEFLKASNTTTIRGVTTTMMRSASKSLGNLNGPPQHACSVDTSSRPRIKIAFKRMEQATGADYPMAPTPLTPEISSQRVILSRPLANKFALNRRSRGPTNVSSTQEKDTFVAFLNRQRVRAIDNVAGHEQPVLNLGCTDTVAAEVKLFDEPAHPVARKKTIELVDGPGSCGVAPDSPLNSSQQFWEPPYKADGSNNPVGDTAQLDAEQGQSHPNGDELHRVGSLGKAPEIPLNKPKSPLVWSSHGRLTLNSKSTKFDSLQRGQSQNQSMPYIGLSKHGKLHKVRSILKDSSLSRMSIDMGDRPSASGFADKKQVKFNKLKEILYYAKPSP